MKHTLLFAALAAASIFSAGASRAAEFTYHGNLQDAGKPAEGTYDLQLTLYSSPEGGKVVAGPLVMYKVPVHEGTFSTEADFGLLTHVSGPSWLGVAVRNAGKGDFAPLSARAPISAAETATNSSCPGSWSLDGNAGNPGGAYLGTADAQDLILKSGGNVVMAAPQSAAGAVALSGAATVGVSHTSGKFSTAVSDSFVAAGPYSFAGGYSAGTLYDGSFVWGDHPSPGHEITDTAPNQFIVQAGGGMAINGAPKNAATELSIYPSPAQSGYTNIFMGQSGSNAGILFSAGAATGTNNDATFYVDQYDGTNQTRKFEVRSSGIIVNDPANIPSGSTTKAKAALSVLPSPGVTTSEVDLYGQDSTNPNLANYWSLVSGPHVFQVVRTEQSGTAAPVATTYLSFSSGFFGASVIATGLFIADSLASNGDINIQGNAYKPGGGMWSAPSDRRIKQDISPIRDALDTVMKLRPVNFRYTPEFRAMEGNLPDRPYAGFIAQEYADVFPTDVVSTSKHVPGAAKGDPTILALDSNPALITTVAAVQELAVQAQDRDGDVAKLRGENAELRSKLDKVLVRLSKLEAGKGR